MTQTEKEANRVLDQLMDIAPPASLVGVPNVQAAELRRISARSKLILLLQQARDDAWVEIMSMVPAILDQTLLDFIEVNAAQARANQDVAAVQRFQRMTRLAEAMMED
jgi:hypothetical protein